MSLLRYLGVHVLPKVQGDVYSSRLQHSAHPGGGLSCSISSCASASMCFALLLTIWLLPGVRINMHELDSLSMEQVRAELAADPDYYRQNRSSSPSPLWVLCAVGYSPVRCFAPGLCLLVLELAAVAGRALLHRPCRVVVVWLTPDRRQCTPLLYHVHLRDGRERHRRQPCCALVRFWAECRWHSGWSSSKASPAWTARCARTLSHAAAIGRCSTSSPLAAATTLPKTCALPSRSTSSRCISKTLLSTILLLARSAASSSASFTGSRSRSSVNQPLRLCVTCCRNLAPPTSSSARSFPAAPTNCRLNGASRWPSCRAT